MANRRSDRRWARHEVALVLLVGSGALAACSPKRAEVTTPQPAPTDRILTGADALGDWSTDAPGVKRKITVADLPAPNEDESVNNRPSKADRQPGMFPKVPSGFAVTELATGLEEPRVVQVAPNGDVFVAESAADRVAVLRDTDGDGKADVRSVYAEDLKRPFGIAFYPTGTDAPTHVYVANTDSVVRFPYKAGDTKASGPAEPLVTNIPSGKEAVGGGGHWTRDIAFSKDNQRMFVSVGSRSNVDDDEDEHRRACILAFTPDGKNETLYASGIRNPVGLAIEPATGALWTSVNERDELGDNLVPDYVTRVQEGGFYGWPWYYLGPRQDPRHEGKHPELRDKVIVPDVLLQSHSASLDLCFYTGQQFPADYQGHIFAAEHGSWNRSRRTGYKVIRIPVKDGKAAGHYEDFMTGFVTNTGDVWGRPVGVAVAKDGALLVTALGLLAVQVLKARGLSVLAVGRTEARLDVARALGADAVAAASAPAQDTAPLAAARALSGREGVDIVIETAGTPEAVARAIELARPGGRVVLTGLPHGPSSVEFFWVVRRELSLFGSMIYQAEFPEAIRLLADGKVRTERLLTHRFPLDAAPEAFQAHRAPESIKVAVIP